MLFINLHLNFSKFTSHIDSLILHKRTTKWLACQGDLGAASRASRQPLRCFSYLTESSLPAQDLTFPGQVLRW